MDSFFLKKKYQCSIIIHSVSFIPRYPRCNQTADSLDADSGLANVVLGLHYGSPQVFLLRPALLLPLICWYLNPYRRALERRESRHQNNRKSKTRISCHGTHRGTSCLNSRTNPTYECNQSEAEKDRLWGSMRTRPSAASLKQIWRDSCRGLVGSYLPNHAQRMEIGNTDITE